MDYPTPPGTINGSLLKKGSNLLDQHMAIIKFIHLLLPFKTAILNLERIFSTILFYNFLRLNISCKFARLHGVIPI